MTDYLNQDDALQIIGAAGFHVKDYGLLASALARPATTLMGKEVYAGLDVKAAALLESVARFHPMHDGNKRTAWLLTAVFVRMNGWKLSSEEPAYELMLDVAEGKLPLEGIADGLRRLMLPLE